MRHLIRTTVRALTLAGLCAMLLVPAASAVAQEAEPYPPPDEAVLPGTPLEREAPPAITDEAVDEAVLAEVLADTGTDLVIPLTIAGVLLLTLGGAVIVVARRRYEPGDDVATR